MKGGGAAAADNLAAYLGYKGTNNGAYLTKVGAARTFGLIAKNGNLFAPTPLAHRILSPVYPHEAKTALIEAFFNVELFKRIYEDFRGRELPPEFGMKNALRNQYGIVPARVDLAYRSLLESADTAGFFATKLGARTHLILPMIHATPAPPSASNDEPAMPMIGGGGGGGGGDDGGMPPAASPVFKPAAANVALSDVKAKYVATLIKLFEAKSEKGELDEKLMERIERLLEGN
ncbi:hypothetical protein ASC76_11190 [Rhizobacter sp. Root404]|nr:hypothetical protein ASC76_11190 [Rhizobacter sp. Root404]